MIDKNDPRLTSFVLGELDPAEHAEIQLSLENSEELRQAVEEIRQVAVLLDASYQSEPPLHLRAEQRAELAELALMQAENETRLRKEPTRSRPWLPIVLAASLMGLLVGGVIYLQDSPLSPSIARRIEMANDLSDLELESLSRTENNNLGSLGSERAYQGGRVANAEEQNDSFAPAGKAVSNNVAEPALSRVTEDRDLDRDLKLPSQTPTAPRQAADPSNAPGKEIRGIIVAENMAEDDILGRDRFSQTDVRGDGFGTDGVRTGQESKQSMQMMQQLAGGGRSSGGGGMGGGGMGGGEGQFDGQSGGGDFGGESEPGLGMGPGSRAGRPGGSNSIPRVELNLIEVPATKKLGQPGSASAGESVDELVGRARSLASEMRSIEEDRIEIIREQKEEGFWSPLPMKSAATPQAGQVGGELSEAESQPADNNQPSGAQSSDLTEEQQLGRQQNRSQAAAVDQPNDSTDSGLEDHRKLKRSEGMRSADSGGELSGSRAAHGRIAKSVVAGRSGTANKDVDALGLELSRQGLAELEELGFRLTTRFRREQQMRLVPVQKTRPVIRSRTIDLGNGVTETENYTVDVPYTENVEEEFTAEVPQVFLDIEAATSERLVLNLAQQIDPGGKREIQMPEFLDKTRELKGSLEGGNSEANQDFLLAIKLSEQMSGDEGKQLDFDVTPALKKVEAELTKRNAKVRKTRTWKRVKAIPNTTRLMLGDKTELDLTGMQVNVQVDGFRARVLLDYFYYNDQGPQREGTFKLRLPDDASLYYFAFGESVYDLSPKGKLATEEFLADGTEFVSLGAEEIRDARQDAWKNVKESRMVPREKAAHAYGETVRKKIDPALVEWSGAGVFNARVFPLAANKLHRIVIGYDVNLKQVDGKLVYELDLPEQTGQCQVDLTVQPIDGVEYSIEPKSDPVENVLGGKTLRHYQFKGPQKETIRLKTSKSTETMLYSAEDYWGVQVTPKLPVEKVAGNPRAIFMVDTSLSSNPDKFNVWLKMLESTLENNRDSLKKFNVVFFNVDAHFWRERWMDNTPGNIQELMQTCDQLALEGATDIYGAIEAIANSDWILGSSQDSGQRLPGPDLFLLSDGAANWGETNLRLMGRQLQDHQFGSLFAYQTGLTGTAISGLRFLAGQSGGAVFSVATENEIKTASTAHRKRPWKLNAIRAAGANDVMTAGRVQWVYPGQSITVVGRGHVQNDLQLEFKQAGQTLTATIEPTRVASELASRLYGQVAVGQLESLGAQVVDVAASYARHFRVTGNTCSLLMLESESEYQRFGIKPQEDLFVIESKEARELIADTLRKSAAELADPKTQLMNWLQRLETMPGMSFKMPTALRLALDDIQVVAISKPLDCSLVARDDLSQAYRNAILKERIDYDVVAAEANRRARISVDDAIKVYSSLVERNPGDLVVARDVAFTAMEMGRPAQAYHLLRSVAQARPYEGSVYPALGQCLAELGQSDMAIVYFEIALGGTFSRMGDDFQKIVAAEYMFLLRKICDDDLESAVKPFAKARLETLKNKLHFETADLLITMMWNTDQTDVDLHIVEPSGEECSYENKKTRSGGQITTDITTGFGPEMYSNPNAPSGKYEVKVKYFASNRNRMELQNKVHLTIYRGFGTPQERATRKTIQLIKVGEKESVATVGVD